MSEADSASQAPVSGRLFVVAAPSGAGKTSLLKRVLGELHDFNVAVSHTTRPPRKSEQHGRDYYFIRPERFEQMVERGEFLEHARVFGHHYGTSRREVEQQLARGVHVVLEIDWQGARQVRRSKPGTVSIFILPPTQDALRERLEGRAQDSPETIAHRLDTAHDEIRHHRDFDVLLTNDDFAQACAALKRLLQGGSLTDAEQMRSEQVLRALLGV